MRILFVGTGAVGGYFGGRLLESGANVSFVGRASSVKKIVENGLRITSALGDVLLTRIRAGVADSYVTPPELIVFAVKMTQLTKAADSCKHLCQKGTLILPLQNGVEAPRMLARIFPREQVLGGLCKILSSRLSTCEIAHCGYQPTVVIGKLDDAQADAVEFVAGQFRRAKGVSVQTPSDVLLAMWEKYLFVTSFAGVGAICQRTAGILRSCPETRSLLEAAMKEIVAVGTAHGIQWGPHPVKDALAIVDSLPETAAASMQRDVMEGKPSELEFLTGSVIRLAREVGLETPINQTIYAALLPRDRDAQQQLGK